MLQNPTRLAGRFFSEQFNAQSPTAIEARLANPGALTVTDEPDESLPTSGGGRTDVTTSSPILGDSGLTTRATAPVSHGVDTPQFATVNFPRLEPAYQAPQVDEIHIGSVSHAYVKVNRGGGNPIEAAVSYLEGEDAVTFAAWWQLMDTFVNKTGAPEKDGTTNFLLKQKTGMLIYVARSAKLATSIPGFMDFLAGQHTALTSGEITDRQQYSRLIALVWDMGRSTSYPVTQYIPLFNILLSHALAATSDKKEAGKIFSRILRDIIAMRPDVPAAARLDIMRRYHDAGLGDIDLMKKPTN